jgi:hypothetical protein
MNVAVLVIILHGQVTCAPQIRDVDLIPETADAYCIMPDRAPLTSPRPVARPEIESENL